MSSHYKGSADELLALNTYIKLIRASDSISLELKNEVTKFGLSESQFEVLDALFHLGPLSQKDLAKKLLKSGGNITMVIDNLERQKLVKRKRGEKDRRFFIIHITEKGKKKVKKTLPSLVNLITDRMSCLDKNEQTDLQKLCKKVGLTD